MIEVVEDPKSWAERHQITLTPIECRKCKKLLELKIPIASKKYRGLKCDINDHECGEEYTPFRVVPIDPETIALFNSIKEKL